MCWASTVAAQAPPPPLVLTNMTVFDPLSARAIESATLVIQDGRIESLSTSSGDVPTGARRIDLNGAWVLPGFVDAHVHFKDLASARAALRRGVTTARVLGVPHFADLGIRELHRRGASDLPEVLGAGYHVRPQLAEELFLNVPQLAPLMTGLSGTDNVRDVVRTLVARGVDVIKVMATHRAGTPDTDPLRRALTDDELAAAVEEAARAGRMVAAHAHTNDGVRAALRAGVRTIEHGTLATDASLRLMKARDACLVPTLSFWLDMLAPGGEYDHPALMARAQEMLPKARSLVARAHRLGVTVAAGSDMGYASEPTLTVIDELEALADSGMPVTAALQAGTSGSAQCLGIAERTGSIAAGREADLLIVTGDPRADLQHLRRPVMIINDGHIAADFRGNSGGPSKTR